MKVRLLAAAVWFIAMLAAAGAQTQPHSSLTLDGANRVIQAAKEYAFKVHAPGGVIAVVDDGGNLMALQCLDGTFAAGANISIGKARTAVLFKKPTKFFEEIVKNGRVSMVTLNDFTPLQGGVPITVDGQIVGAVGVSGAASAQQDEELALAGAAAFTSGDVKIFQPADVVDGFAKGAVLFDGQGRNYMVHASRRTESGRAEVHTSDADVIYVLDGEAEFVTGGTVVAPAHIASDEIRGSGIDGGSTTKLTKGMVVIVPPNTPHWFKSVTNPFLYYVVKVR